MRHFLSLTYFFVDNTSSLLSLPSKLSYVISHLSVDFMVVTRFWCFLILVDSFALSILDNFESIRLFFLILCLLPWDQACQHYLLTIVLELGGIFASSLEVTQVFFTLWFSLYGLFVSLKGCSQMFYFPMSSLWRGPHLQPLKFVFFYAFDVMC